MDDMRNIPDLDITMRISPTYLCNIIDKEVPHGLESRSSC